MTASLAPRMRVDNCVSVWYGLNGTKASELPFAELFEVQWRPEAPNNTRFTDISSAEIEHALSGASTRLSSKSGSAKKAYRPPSGRDAGDSKGGNKVAMMMRGEIDSSPLGGLLPVEKLAESSDSKAQSEKMRKLDMLDDHAVKSGQPQQMHGSKAACPTSGWEYMDKKGKKQGPFALEQMQKWMAMGAFKGDLPLRCDPNDRFVPLRDLFPHPMVPFHRAPKRPS